MSDDPGGIASLAGGPALLKSTSERFPTNLLARIGQMVMNLPYIDRIWRTQGELRLDEALSPQEAFARLDPLFQAPGTQLTVDGDTLSYAKRNPAAQDKLATFTRGTLRVEQRGGNVWLRFDLSSTALLLCFLAPLLFLGFAQLAVAANAWEKANAVAEKAEADEDKDKAKPVRKLNPIDEMLGAPPPEDPNKKKDKEKDKDKGRHSPKPGYVLAGLFAVIYLVGRMLEPWLIRRTFRTALAEAAPLSGRSPETDGSGA